jgi:tetratricopeptide (TPR) repeat protein
MINNLANLYKAQSKLDSAEEMYRRALQGFEQAYGLDQTLTLSTVNNLANVYKSQDRVENASVM